MPGLGFAGSTTSAGAPDIDPGIYPARFDGVAAKVLEKSQFDPNVYIWSFTLLDEDGATLYDEGEPVTVEALTSRSFNVKSKTTPRAVRYLKAIMTDAEFARFEIGETVPEEDLVGRTIQLLLSTNDNGWPKVDDVIRVPTVKKKIKPASAAEE